MFNDCEILFPEKYLSFSFRDSGVKHNYDFSRLNVPDMSKSSDIILYADNVNQILLKPVTSLYQKRVLNEDVEESIVEQASLLPRHAPITVTVYLPASANYREEEIATAVHHHFTFLEKKSKTQIKQVLQHGGRSLIIGFAFLTFMVLLSEAGRSLFSMGGLFVTIRESLAILGWVAFWRPAELLLYDWYPFKRNAKLFDRLKRSKVQIITGNNTGSK
jgi:hypothetical protein